MKVNRILVLDNINNSFVADFLIKDKATSLRVFKKLKERTIESISNKEIFNITHEPIQIEESTNSKKILDSIWENHHF